MPRVDSRQPASRTPQTFTGVPSRYITAPVSPRSSSSASSKEEQKRKHACPNCDKSFTTSGHLARHARVHTGERKHACPFPGCETRCSRQDNLQQHYRIHLSPGSRRTSSRSQIPRVMDGVSRRVSTAAAKTASPPPPPSSPPALEPARIYMSHTSPQHSPPPDSPPPLTQAILPGMSQAVSYPSRSSSSPSTAYSTPTDSVVSSPVDMATQYPQRSGTTAYQSHSQGHSQSHSYSYIQTPNGFDGHRHLPQLDTLASAVSPVESPQMFDSRNSMAHLSPSHSPSAYTSTPNSPSPPSSVSLSPHEPYTPYDSGKSSYSSSPTTHYVVPSMTSPSELMHAGYSQVASLPARYHSPPPVLAPLQGADRSYEYDRKQPPQLSSSYIHHPQPIVSDYYHSSVPLSGGEWNGARIREIGSVAQ